MKQKQKKLWLDIRKNAGLYALVAIPIIWYIVFKYIPMYGLQIAFRRFNPTLGITKSPWVGLTYFKQFFQSYYFKDVLVNTLSLSVFTMLDLSGSFNQRNKEHKIKKGGSEYHVHA